MDNQGNLNQDGQAEGVSPLRVQHSPAEDACTVSSQENYTSATKWLEKEASALEYRLADTETAREKLDKKGLFRIYGGHELMSMEFPPKEWLIEGLIFRGDSVLLVGDAKAGKSLLIQSAMCALTSGGVFLQKYQCHSPQKVLYVQLEGELADTKGRLEKLSVETPLNKDNFFCFYAEPMELQDRKCSFEFIEGVMKECGKIDVLIIDCMYQAFKGSLKDDEVIREFIGNIRLIKACFNCTVIILHHMRKPSIDPASKEVIDSGDNATFGSAFLKAWPDHLLLLKHQANSDVRKLTCTTQRSGEIESEVNLVLVQPDPLFWKTLDEIPKGIVYEKAKESIVAYLNSTPTNSAHSKELQKILNIPRTTFYAVEKTLRGENKIWKEGSGKDTIYRSFSYEKK